LIGGNFPVSASVGLSFAAAAALSTAADLAVAPLTPDFDAAPSDCRRRPVGLVDDTVSSMLLAVETLLADCGGRPIEFASLLCAALRVSAAVGDDVKASSASETTERSGGMSVCIWSDVGVERPCFDRI
jgi:hypothetical protein